MPLEDCYLKNLINNSTYMYFRQRIGTSILDGEAILLLEFDFNENICLEPIYNVYIHIGSNDFLQ